MRSLIIVVLMTLCVCSCGKERAKFVYQEPKAEVQYLDLDEIPGWAIALHKEKGGCQKDVRLVGEWKPTMFPEHPRAFAVGCFNHVGTTLIFDHESRKLLAEMDLDENERQIGDLVFYAHIRTTQLDASLCGGKSLRHQSAVYGDSWVRFEVPCPPSHAKK